MAESSKGDRENKLRSKYALELDLISRERYEMKLKLFDGGFVVPDPYGIKDNEWSLDITKWPPVEYADLFNYFINTPGLYTKESLKAYKSLEGYDYFVSGHVQEVYMCEISPESPVTLLKSRVKPSQRMNDEPHEPWICVDRHAGYIIAAHCTCKAGLALLYRDAAVFCSGPIGFLRNLLVKAIRDFVPSSFQYLIINIGNKLFYTRTCFFQVIFIVLCLLGHAVWVVDMIPILVKHYPDQNHTFWPFVAVFINYYFLHKAWITDPGEITKSNVDKYLTVYKYDELLYNKNVDCSTCKTVKPARSKHCSVCNCCVHRFDHHCIWTNNCVGAYTHRYFILFMMSLIAMFLQGIYVGSWCIMDFANDIRLFKASYIKDDGSIHPITFSVAFQHLFMQLPRLVFLVIGLSVLTVLVFVFLCQHIYFIITNQTTNETYKIKYIDWETLQQDDSKDDGSKGTKKLQIIYQPSYKPYDQGVLQNFIEHLFMQLPRLVFLVIGLSVLTVLVFVFLCQHIYFIITNQTTNETYKIKYIDWETLQQDDSKDDGSKGTKKLQIIYQPSYKPYDQGVLQNFIEVFFPKYFMHQKLKAMNKL